MTMLKPALATIAIVAGIMSFLFLVDLYPGVMLCLALMFASFMMGMML